MARSYMFGPSRTPISRKLSSIKRSQDQLLVCSQGCEAVGNYDPNWVIYCDRHNLPLKPADKG